MVRTVERRGDQGPVDKWRALRSEIKQWILEHGVDDRGVIVQYEGSDEVDASLLMVPLVGFLPPDDERVRPHVEAIDRELTVDGFVYRYRHRQGLDGLPPGEGTFLLCSFWMVQVLALIGREQEATARFEKLLRCAMTSGCCPRSTTQPPDASWATSVRRSVTRR